METLEQIIYWLLQLKIYLLVGFSIGTILAFIVFWIEEKIETKRFLEEIAKKKKK